MRRAGFAIGILVLALAAIAWLRPAEPPAGESQVAVEEQPEPSLAPASVPAPATPAPTAPATDEPTVASHDPITEPEAPPVTHFREADYGKSREQIYFEFYREVLRWTPEVYQSKLAQADSLTGAEIYQVYVYLRSCLDTPRTVKRVDERVRNLQHHHQEDPANFTSDQLNDMIRRYEDGLARCQGIGADLDLLEPVLVDWLTLAADRGFGQAKLAYYQSTRWLLRRKPRLMYRQPERVHAYRQKAPLYLKQTLETGHTEAFTELALAYNEGVVLPRDPIAAYAHGYAADLASHGQHQVAKDYLLVLETELSADEQRQAREQGRALCDRYCR